MNIDLLVQATMNELRSSSGKNVDEAFSRVASEICRSNPSPSDISEVLQETYYASIASSLKATLSLLDALDVLPHLSEAAQRKILLTPLSGQKLSQDRPHQ